jgi:cell division protein FtsQ
MNPPNRRVRKGRMLHVVDAPDEQAIAQFIAVDAGDDASERMNPEHAPGPVMELVRAVARCLLALGSAFFFVYALVRYTRTSPRFAIRVIEVHGNARRTVDEIKKRAGVAPGQNIFTADLEAMRAVVLDDPWIETAALSRRLPATVTIDITEREAAALVAVGSDLYLATRQGEAFKRPEAGDPSDLPVITGIHPDDLDRRGGAALAVRRALEVASDYERTPPAKAMPLQEVHIEDDGSLVLSVGKDAVELRLGKGSWRRRLEQASRVLFELPRRGVLANVVFLDNEAHPERVVVRTR